MGVNACQGNMYPKTFGLLVFLHIYVCLFLCTRLIFFFIMDEIVSIIGYFALQCMMFDLS